MSESTGLGGRIDDVDEPLVRAHFKVPPAAVLDFMGATDNDEDVLPRSAAAPGLGASTLWLVSTILRAELR